MLHREIIAVYCNNRTKYINTFCEQNAETFNVKPGGTHINHQGLRGYCEKPTTLVTAHEHSIEQHHSDGHFYNLCLSRNDIKHKGQCCKCACLHHMLIPRPKIKNSSLTH